MGLHFIALVATFLFVVTECRLDLNENGLHYTRAKRNDREHDTAEKRYTSTWAVEITEGGDNMADETATRYGFKNLGKVRVYHKITNVRAMYFHLYNFFVYRLMDCIMYIILN